MLNKINEIIDKTSDTIMLKSLKLEVTAKDADVDAVINRYINNYDEKNNDIVNYEVNLGYDKTIDDYKKMYSKLKPCGNPLNYHKMNIKARGKWKDIYEISFGTPNLTITTKKLNTEKTKQRRIKEAA